MLTSARRSAAASLASGVEYTPGSVLELRFCAHLHPGAPGRNVAMPFAQGVRAALGYGAKQVQEFDSHRLEPACCMKRDLQIFYLIRTYTQGLERSRSYEMK
jgi:hypothetical protein